MNRILKIEDIEHASKILQEIEVSSQGVVVMAPKLLQGIVKLENIRLGAANILKQEMLSLGGDAAVARGVVNGKKESSDVILIGNVDKLKKLIRKLDHQNIFGLPEIKKDLIKFVKIIQEKSQNKIKIKDREIDISPVKIVGILNLTPDSFSDGSQFNEIDKALERTLEMKSHHADFIDIGGESSRPGADPVDAEEELKRVIPVIKEIRKVTDIPISIDTYKRVVAEKAINAGADIVNDISSLRMDSSMIDFLAEAEDVPVIIMHMQGQPKNMQRNPHYNDVISEISDFFRERIEACLTKGIERNRIIIDPGIGFGKRQEDNLKILNRLDEFKSLEQPILLGASRKSFIGRIYESTAKERLSGTLATSALAFKKKINLVRVHDVKENYELIKTLKTIKRES